MTNILQPMIYAACLSAYNAGILHGAWIDANQDADAIQADIQTMLTSSPIPKAEEWAIHDYQDFAGIELSEGEDISKVSLLADILIEHGEPFAAYASYVGNDFAILNIKEAYCGE